MCGVAGAFLQPDGARLVQTMVERIGHRGPDASGVVDLLPTAPVQLGHRRLSIIDLSAAADQPFVSDGLHLSYNGELYNYRELRDELRGQRRPVPDRVRHRGRPRVLAAVGHRRAAPAAGHVRLRPLRRARRRPHPGAGPARHQAAVRAAARRGIVFASELKALVTAVGPELTVDPAGLVASTMFYFLPEQQLRRSRRSSSCRAGRGRSGGPTARSRSGRYWEPAAEAAGCRQRTDRATWPPCWRSPWPPTWWPTSRLPRS